MAVAVPGMQQVLLAERWLARALPLLQPPAPGTNTVLAVEPGCEAEAAMACVACLVEHQGQGLYPAMVAASQWGLDLHLQPHHLLALQHFAASAGRH